MIRLLQSHCSAAVMQGMYKASKKRFDDDADFKERARRAVTLLQGGDPEFTKAWERICEASRKVSPLCAQPVQCECSFAKNRAAATV